MAEAAAYDTLVIKLTGDDIGCVDAERASGVVMATPIFDDDQDFVDDVTS